MEQLEEKIKEQPAYIAILPANVRYDNKLKAMEKIMYAEITALSNAKGYCFASNAYFARLYNSSKKTISTWINSLKKQGYVDIELVYENDTIKERRIYIADKRKVSISEGVSLKKWRGYPSKNGGGIPQNVKDNNININNINNNIYSASENDAQAEEIDIKKKQIEEQSEHIWKLYPHKRGKATAIKKIPKLIKKYGYEQLQRCIDRYVADVDLRRRTDFKELKYQNGSTFFNSGYMDYLDTEYKNKEEKQSTSKIQGKTDIDLSFWD